MVQGESEGKGKKQNKRLVERKKAAATTLHFSGNNSAPMQGR